MSYSMADAKVTEVLEAVAAAHTRLKALLIEQRRVVERLDRSVEGAREIVTEIETNAAGDPLWQRLKERKDQVATDLQAVKAIAQRLEAAYESELR